MKTVFSKIHFLLFALLLACAMMFAVSQFVTEANQLFLAITHAVDAFSIALIFFFLLKEINRASALHNNLQMREKYLSVTLNSLGEGVITTNAESIIQDMNPSAQVLTGWNEAEAIGKPLEKIYDVVNDETRKPFQNMIIRVLREGKPIDFENNTLLRKKDGTEIIISNSGSPIRDADGKITGVVLTFRDITASKLAEKAIRELNENLEKRVKERTEELEFFAYSVSHDLRAPLRTINGFSRILKSDYNERLDENGKNLLNSIAENAFKMDRLIEDLLKLSRLGKADLIKNPTNMQALVVSVIDDLEIQQRDKGVEIVTNNLPEANCDKGLIKQVWVNLISNAVKYSARNAKPKVEIGYALKNGTDAYYVKDNGIGFDMQDAHRLFSICERLPSAEEFEGTGIGLVIASRVIKKHGGRIFAEAESGKGASFYFTLPEIN